MSTMIEQSQALSTEGRSRQQLCTPRRVLLSAPQANHIKASGILPANGMYIGQRSKDFTFWKTEAP
jgi:hypothetical protein